MSVKGAERSWRTKTGLMGSSNLGLLSASTAIEQTILSEVFEFYEAEREGLSGLEGSKRSSSLATSLNRFEKKLTSTITGDKGYNQALGKYLRTFDQMDTLNARIHDQLSEIDISDVIKSVDPQKKDVIDTIVSQLTGKEIQDNFSQPVKRMLFNNLLTGANQKDARKQLRDFIAGDEEKLGHLRRYVGQVSRDALQQYDGALNDAVRSRFKMNAWRYVGTLVEDTRPQCTRWLTDPKFNGIIKHSDLQAELNNTSNRGQNPETTVSTFGTYRGGFNCRHQAIPFRLRETKPVDPPEPDEPKPLSTEDVKVNTFQFQPHRPGRKFTFGKSHQDKVPENWAEWDTQLPDQFWGSMPQRIAVNQDDLDGAFYNPRTSTVNLPRNERWRKSDYYKKKVSIHEFNHGKHFIEQEVTYGHVSDRMNKIYKAERKALRDRFEGSSPAISYQRAEAQMIPSRSSERFRSLAKEIIDESGGEFTLEDVIEMRGATADMLGSITNGAAGWGHKKSYYRSHNFRFMEMYVHMSENFWIGNPYFQKVWPKFYRQTLQTMEEING